MSDDGPCPRCTHLTPDQCPGRSHRALCRHLECDPATWGPKIASLPPSDAPPRVLEDRGPCPEKPAPAPVVPASRTAKAKAASRAPSPDKPPQALCAARWAVCQACEHFAGGFCKLAKGGCGDCARAPLQRKIAGGWLCPDQRWDNLVDS